MVVPTCTDTPLTLYVRLQGIDTVYYNWQWTSDLTELELQTRLYTLTTTLINQRTACGHTSGTVGNTTSYGKDAE